MQRSLITGIFKIARIPNRLTKENHRVRIICLRVGRRVRDETETYSPGLSDLSLCDTI